MSERDSYIPGVPCWVDTSHPDQEAVLAFYSGLFGWEFEDVMPEGSPSSYFIGRIGGRDAAAIGSVPDGAPPMASWTTYVSVDSADDAAAKARAAGGEASEPFDVGEFGRMSVITDPEGATLCVWQSKQHHGAQVVNQHGALNFNGLATRDVARAKVFYGALFGWQSLPLPSGEMWTLPGYGDDLEKASPGLGQQMEQMGAPSGFIDVVAAINPIADDDSATPAHWSVTFGVDDAEATAKTATSLGGDIVAGPFDAPWTKLVVIKDPQGATFIAGQFVIENKDLEA